MKRSKIIFPFFYIFRWYNKTHRIRLVYGYLEIIRRKNASQRDSMALRIWTLQTISWI